MKSMTVKNWFNQIGSKIVDGFAEAIEDVKKVPSELKKVTWKNVKHELFSGWSLFEKIFIPSLILMQIIVFIIYPESPWGMVAGVTGVICVTFVAKGKISNYYFGFVQTGIMLVLGLQAFLWGEFLENAFYFATQFKGYKEWNKNTDKGSEDEIKTVNTQKLNGKQWVLLVLAVSLATLVLGFIFGFMNGTQPYLDAYTLIAAIVGQMLMVYRFREQWLFWLSLNVVSMYQWSTIGNMSLFSLYVALTINAIYGYVIWTKNAKKEQVSSIEVDK